MSGRSLTTEQILAMLIATPQHLAALTNTADPARLQARPAPGEWSATEILAHLRACADLWGDAIATIIAQDKPTLRAISPRVWIKSTDYPAQPFRPSLRAFATQRADLLTVLNALPPADWSRAILVTGEGRPRERTIRFYADRLARHEYPHVEQIERAIATIIQN